MSKDNLERLAIAQALYKELGRIVGTGNPSNLRGACDEELRGLFEDSGGSADRMSIRINGQKVGELTVNCTTESREERLEITDWEAFSEWRVEPKQLMEFILSEGDELERMRQLAEWYLTTTGEMPDGCDLVETYVPGGIFKNTTIKGITVGKVSKALGVPLVNEVAALLEAGD